MPELNIDLDYFEHPKTMLLVERLGDWAEILPIRLWRFAARFHAETGEITGPSASLIERHLNWRGKKGEGIEALVACGFLEPIEGGYLVHDFCEHQGHIEAYKKRGKKAADARWGKMRPDASGMPQECNKHPPSIAASNALTDGRTDETDGRSERSEASPAKPQKLAPPEDLAQRFWFAQVGRKEDQYALAETIRELIRVGCSPDAIRAEIDRPGRNRGERFFKLADRLEKTSNAQAASDDARKRELVLGRKP